MFSKTEFGQNSVRPAELCTIKYTYPRRQDFTETHVNSENIHFWNILTRVEKDGRADTDNFVLRIMNMFKAVAAFIFVWVQVGGLGGSGYFNLESYAHSQISSYPHPHRPIRPHPAPKATACYGRCSGRQVKSKMHQLQIDSSQVKSDLT